MRPGHRAAWGLLLLRAVGAVDAVHDSAALLQASVQTQTQELALSDSVDILRPRPYHLQFGGKEFGRPPSAPVDCAAYPALCSTPFNCAESPAQPAAAQLNEVGSNTHWTKRLMSAVKTSKANSRVLYATSEGRANMNWYCGTQEQYAMMACAAGNLSGYAQLKKLEKPRGEGNLLHRTIHELHHDMLAQYCFNMGHCADERVGEGMTLAQGEELCDQEFGHQTWASFTEQDMEMARFLSGVDGTLKLNMLSPQGLASVKLGRPSAKVIGKMSCAEGHYHCDVYMCKANYCKDESYWKKYHHRLPKQP